jgi:hypothetical protein
MLKRVFVLYGRGFQRWWYGKLCFNLQKERLNDVRY